VGWIVFSIVNGYLLNFRYSKITKYMLHIVLDLRKCLNIVVPYKRNRKEIRTQIFKWYGRYFIKRYV